MQTLDCASEAASSKICLIPGEARSVQRLLTRSRMKQATNIECKQEAGVFAPVIDRTRCEGKEDCVQVCPYDVFEMRKLSREDKDALPFAARMKPREHR